jgi:hypothetical protein
MSSRPDVPIGSSLEPATENRKPAGQETVRLTQPSVFKVNTMLDLNSL